MSYRALLVHVGDLQRAIVTHLPGGREKLDWLPIRRGVPMLVRPARVPADITPAHVEDVTHVVHIEYDAELVAGQRERWQILHEGAVYAVVLPYDPGGRQHHLEVRCRKET